MPVLESSADQAYYHQLPTVSFRVIEDKSLETPAGVHSEQSRNYGYNDFKDFERPEFYIRYIEPIEAELRVQVEYDMDEQDQAWLDAINEERKKDQSGPISYEVFEIIMDKLEKEWFELIKRIPQPASHLPVEDSKCAVCDDGEGENSNAIVFCDGCNLAVHQDCYGVPYIPEGQWLCRKCTVSPENPVSCLFCPNEGGAFKQTQTGHWAHLLCAIYIPELGVGNAIYMEPVEGVELVPKSRWKLICSLCKERYGACIQCDNRSCFTAFHVTCARQMGLLQGMKSLAPDAQLRAFCHKHLPADAQGVIDLDEEDSDYSAGSPAASRPRQKKQQKPVAVTTKSARAHAKSYRPGPPIVPHVIVQSLLDYVSKISIRKRQAFVERLCRYWSLKREARRGAPLLKRLHLEPWTASSASKEQTDAEKATKLMFLMKLRNDLEKVRMLADEVRKREREKLKQSQVIKDVVDYFLFPHYAKLRLVLEKISAMDRQELFLNPVNPVEVPDYPTVIKEPMCWLWIDEKLEKNTYKNVAEFVRDVHLVLDNAMLYNKGESPYHRTAKRIKTNSQPLLDGLGTISAESALVLPGDDVDSQQELDVGDLEPSRLLLQTLMQPETADASRDHLASIFAYELEKPKEPTPPPPTPPGKKRKVETAEEKRKRREEREARAREREKAGPVRATRASLAMEKAFVEEAGIQEPTKSVDPGSSRTRSRRSAAADVADAESSTPARRGHRQVGVVGLATYNAISDKERRRMEKEMNLATDEVGKEDLFARFNVGWVLPEGSKRHRAERPPAPPKPQSSRKRKGEGSNPSPSESIPAPFAPSSIRTPSPRPSSLTPVSSLSPATPDTVRVTPRAKPSSSQKAKPNGKSGTLDLRHQAARNDRQKGGRSNATQKGAQQDASGQPLDQEEEEDMTPVPPSPMPSSPKVEESVKQAPTEEEKEHEEEQVQKSGPGDDEGVSQNPPDSSPVKGGSERKSRATTRAKSTPRRKAARRTTSVEHTAPEPAVEKGDTEEDPFPPGTLVWARLGTWPHFPAEIIDENLEDENDPIPKTLLDQREELARNNGANGGRVWLARFFDKQNSYGWIPASRLDLLSSDDSIDAMYLAGKDRGSRRGFKNSKLRQEVSKAYRDALAFLENDDGEGGDEDEGEAA